MSVAVAEADDLVLDRGAIARSGALDLPGIHRRAMHIGPDHLMGCGGGPGGAPLALRGRGPGGPPPKQLPWIVAGPPFHPPPLDRRPLGPGRRAAPPPAPREAGPP